MKKVLTLLPLLLVVTTASAIELSRDSSKECAVCHYEWMSQFIFDLKGTDIVDYQSEKVVATEKMCFSCHNGTVGDGRIRIWSGDMHKISDNIPENMKIPEILPLDKGRINCRTCHSAHATGDPKAEGVEKSVFLRMENNDSQLCEACHTNFSGGLYKSHPLKTPEKNYEAIQKKLTSLGARLGKRGQIVCQSCHTPHSPKDEKLLIYNVDDSKLCSICHGDKVNPENAVYVKGMLNHPIDIKHDSPEVVAKVKKNGGIYGKNNQLVCLTCHTAHKGKNEKLLIKENGDSQLCITCHDSQKHIAGSKHDMLKVEGFRTKDGKTAKEVGICQSCHAPHGWSLNLSQTGGDMLSKGCLSCHQEGKFAGKKMFSPELFHHPVGKEIRADMSTDELPLFVNTNDYFDAIGSEGEQKNIVTCATCHDVHSKTENCLREGTVKGRLCVSCHKEKEMIEKTVHGKKKLDKGCLSCHRVHNSESKSLLKVRNNDGCLKCHQKGGEAEKLAVDLEHSHPVNIHLKKSLPEGFKTTPEGLFTCLSCHDPHKPSKTDKVRKDFLRGGYTGIDAFCSACHEAQKEIKGSDHDNRKNTTDSVCGQCHSVHNANSTNNLLAMAYDYEERDDACKACHNEKGDAGKKVITGGHKIGKVDQPEKYRKYLTENDGELYIYCSSCHTVHNNGPAKGTEGNIKNSFLDKELVSNENFCLGCHEDKNTLSASKHNVNRFEKHTDETEALIAQKDSCGVCHKVHNSGYKLFAESFSGDYEKICLDCHTKKGLASKTSISTSHKINIETKKKLNVPLQDGRIVCVSCHEPHAGSNSMLRNVGGNNLCITCHDEQKPVTLTEHNLAGVTYLESEVKETAQRNVCMACHKPHNFHKDNRLMWAFEPKKIGLFRKKGVFAFEICTDCHTKDGLGRKKIPEALTHDNLFKILPMKTKKYFEPYLFDDAGLPSMDGSITCQSCHNPHLWKAGMTTPAVGVEGSAADSFLRQEVKDAFCSKCHGMEHSKELFEKYHDDNFRVSRKNKLSEEDVLRNLMLIQMNLKKIQDEEIIK